MQPTRLYSPFPVAATLIAAILVFAPAAAAKCDNCGTVTDVKTISQQGEASGVGAVAGGVLGGVLGHQIGSGRGNTAATIVGAGAGAYAGHEVEKSQKRRTTYQVIVKMEDGKSRTFNFSSQTSYRAGDKVRVIDGKLTRD